MSRSPCAEEALIPQRAFEKDPELRLEQLLLVKTLRVHRPAGGDRPSQQGQDGTPEERREQSEQRESQRGESEALRPDGGEQPAS